VEQTIHRTANSRRARHGVDSMATLSGIVTASIRSNVITTVIQADISLVLGKVTVTQDNVNYDSEDESSNVITKQSKTVAVRDGKPKANSDVIYLLGVF
jgi:hypothetical protein